MIRRNRRRTTPGKRADEDERSPLVGNTPRPPDPPVEGHVVVLGRSGCHLCDDVLALCSRVAVERSDLLPDPVVVVDVDEDPQVKARWGDHVPVTFVDGVLIAYWFLDRDTLVSALEDGPTPVPVVP